MPRHRSAARRSPPHRLLHGLEPLESRRVLADVSGVISTNTTWSNTSEPYVLIDNVLVRNGATLTIAPGVEVRSVSDSSQVDLLIGDDGTTGKLAADGVNFYADVTFGVKGSGTIANSTYAMGTLTVKKGGTPIVSNTDFHNDPARLPVTLEPMFVPHLAGRGNTFDVDAVAGILAGTVNADTTWGGLPGVANFHLLDNVDVRAGAALTLASNHALTTILDSSEVKLRVGGSFNAENTRLRADVEFQPGSTGMLRNNSVELGTITVLPAASPTVEGNSFHNNPNRIPISVAPEFVPSLADRQNVFLADAIVGVEGGHIDADIVWPVLSAATTLQLQGNVSITDGGQLTISPGWKVRTILDSSEIELHVGTEGTLGVLRASCVLFRNVIVVGPQGVLELHNSTIAARRMDLASDAQIDLRFNVFNALEQIRIAGSSGQTVDLADNVWGTTSTAAIDARIYDDDEDAGLPAAVVVPLLPPNTIGHRVWLDVDRDGKQDRLEPGVAGVTVKLWDEGNDEQNGTADDVLVATTITDADGAYRFSGVAPGPHYLQVVLPADLAFTDANRTFDCQDSDVELIDRNYMQIVSGRTATFMLIAGQATMAHDVGLVDATSNSKPTFRDVGSSTYRENATPISIAPWASVGDSTSSDFNFGQLKVQRTTGGGAPDRLAIRQQGVGAGQISIAGSDVRYGGRVIGKFSGGNGSTPLLVTFNREATVAAVQALVRNVTFETLGDNPLTTARTVKLVLSDGDGGISTTATASVNVQALNDKPIVTLSGTIGYVHDKPALVLAPSAGVSDVDSADFSGGRLRVRITDGASASNRLSIGAGFTVDANNNVLQGTTIIGKRVAHGFGTQELVITFNTNATPAVVQQLVRAITFNTAGGSAGVRKVVFTVSDGDGGLSAEASKSVNVS